MNNKLTWKQAKSGHWWLALPLGEAGGWKGVALVFRRDLDSPWTVSVPHLIRDGAATEVRDTRCVSLHAACAQAEEWAEGRGFEVAERFPAEIQPPSPPLAETNRQLAAMPPAQITAEDARRQVEEHRAESLAAINHPPIKHESNTNV